MAKLKVVLLSVVLSSAAMASDLPDCHHSYCSGHDYYTNGYLICPAGEGCYCDYTLIPDAPQCAGPSSIEEVPIEKVALSQGVVKWADARRLP